MASVTGSECRPSRGDDAGDLDVTKVDGSPDCPSLCSETCRLTSRFVVEGENPSLEILIDGAAERVLELPFASAGREQLQTEADLEDGHRSPL